MAKASLLKPSYIFESSWEVCHKVGGIYTVLSTHAATLQKDFPDHVIFIGPDFEGAHENLLFEEDKALHADWQQQAAKETLKVRVGRWLIPGRPIAILVDFSAFYEIKNDLYAALWRDYSVDSLHAYGDYDEASMFSYAAGRVVESFYDFYLYGDKNVIYQAHEWMTGLGVLYVQRHVPTIATVFTTHATTIGRSIAGNGKPLYEYLFAYNGNQMAEELNVQSKHSIERQTANAVDCFTTVSDVTDKECFELLDKHADVVLPNGFEMDFVPKGAAFTTKRKQARKMILDVANALMGGGLTDETLIVSTSGRYEWRNKGLDVYVESMCKLQHDDRLQRPVLALVEVPVWQAQARADLKERLQKKAKTMDTEPLPYPFLTHDIPNMEADNVVSMLRRFSLQNASEDKVKVMFVPCYLDGKDGIFNVDYYDLLIGLDLCLYPSYYEPWGYTPLESVAFKIPCITTSLSGFGCWVNALKGAKSTLKDGVEVIERTDYNYEAVCTAIREAMVAFSAMKSADVKAAREAAANVAEQAQWKHFIQFYYEAYDKALRKRQRK